MIMKKFITHELKLDLPHKIELYLNEVRDNKSGLVFCFLIQAQILTL
jgi:hypothetical protein